MPTINKLLALVSVVLLFGCTDRDTQAKLAAIDTQNKEMKAQLEKIDGQTKELKAQLEKVAEALPQVDRYKMLNGGVGGSDLPFLYDTQTGSVWRYYRNWSKDHKEITDEGFQGLLLYSARQIPSPANPMTTEELLNLNPPPVINRAAPAFDPSKPSEEVPPAVIKR
jgi:outer membrane murein-binding lipoprotein Lpp